MLTGKKVLITGASSGIGRSTAIILTKEGAQVCGVGRNEEALKLVRASLREMVTIKEKEKPF